MTAPVVVGGGLTGAACAIALAESGLPVVLHEQADHLGGRMASVRLRETGTAFDGRVVDVGASYLTVRDDAFAEVVDTLVGHGVLRPWADAFHVADSTGLLGVSAGPMRYAAPGGLTDVVRTLTADVPGLTVRLSSPVERVTVGHGQVTVDDEPRSAAALCLPAPTAERLCPLLPPSPVGWEPAVAVTLVFDHRCWPDLDGVFVNDDEAVTWIADDGRRRGDEAPVLVAFAHPVLSARHLTDPTGVLPAVVATVRHLLGIDATPDWVSATPWRHAKPLVARTDPCWLDPAVPVGQAGDAWADGPRIEAAWLSGRALGVALADRLARQGG